MSMDGMSWSDQGDTPFSLHIQVSGRVQGVGFRAWTAHEATRLGITGFVRNCSDGSVEIRAEGSPYTLESFCTLLEAGNGLSRTEQIYKKQVQPHGYTRFSITY